MGPGTVGAVRFSRGREPDLIERWLPLRDFVRGSRARDVRHATHDLLGGIEPENAADPRELLALALLAVSVNRTRLCDEFAARRFLGPDASLDALVTRQEDLTREAIGTSGPLKTLGVLVAESLPAAARSRLHRSIEPGWAQAANWRVNDAAVIWLAAVRFGHLAQTVAQALELEETVPFYRYLPASRSRARAAALAPNDIACVNEPWAAGTRRIHEFAEHGSRVYELAVAPAAIVAVTHIDPARAHEEHPARFCGESGHFVVTAYPPLARYAPRYYTGPHRLVPWREVAPAEVFNHREPVTVEGDDTGG